MLIGEIAEIRTGLVLARKKAEIELEVKASYPVITLKNIDVHGMFTDEALDVFESKEELGEEYFTQQGDVLMRLSHPNTAIYIDEDKAGLLIPSYFACIRIASRSFLPGYVAWFLNTDKVKVDLLKHQAGTNIPSTNKSVLEQISIPVEDMQRQQLITAVQELYHKERVLYQKLILEKEKLYKALSESLIRK